MTAGSRAGGLEQSDTPRHVGLSFLINEVKCKRHELLAFETSRRHDDSLAHVIAERRACLAKHYPILVREGAHNLTGLNEAVPEPEVWCVHDTEE